MTHEEAKKMGATHYDEFGNYYLAINKGCIISWYQLIDNEWGNCQSMFFNPKPL